MDIVKKIILNSNYEFLINNFNRNSYVQDGTLISTVYVSLKSPTSSQMDQLRGLAAILIEELSVTVDGAAVYELENIEGRINSIEESLADDGTMRVSFTMSM